MKIYNNGTDITGTELTVDKTINVAGSFQYAIEDNTTIFFKFQTLNNVNINIVASDSDTYEVYYCLATINKDEANYYFTKTDEELVGGDVATITKNQILGLVIANTSTNNIILNIKQL